MYVFLYFIIKSENNNKGKEGKKKKVKNYIKYKYIYGIIQ